MAWSVVFMLATTGGTAFASEDIPQAMPADWVEVGFRPNEYFGETTRLQIRNGTLFFNGHEVTDEQALRLARMEANKDPAPPLFVRLPGKHVAPYYALAKKLSDSGICRQLHCLYTVAGRKYAKPDTLAVP